MANLIYIAILLIALCFASVFHFVSYREGLYATQMRSDINAMQKKIKNLEKEVEAAKWDALWAQNLLVVNMDSVGQEIRRINKKVGMTPWGWSPREY